MIKNGLITICSINVNNSLYLHIKFYERLNCSKKTNLKMSINQKKLKITPKPKKQTSKMTAWCIKCNKPFAAITALIIFTTVLGVVIYNMKNEKSGAPTNDTITLEKSFSTKDISKCKPTREGTTCNIKCSNFDESNIDTLGPTINNLTLKGCTIFYLTFEVLNLVDATIKRGWLSDINIEIDSLSIQSSNLMIIDDYAFADHPFTFLTMLNLYETQMEALSQNSFHSSQLTNFQFSFHLLKSIQVDENLFEGISSSLKMFQFLNCFDTVDVLHKITGIKGSNLQNVIEIDLRYNKLTKLTNSSFKNVPNVQVIYLEDGGLESIESGTFQNLFKLISLNIAQNSLTTLPDGIFNFISSGTVMIGGNPWNCNCELVWLRDFYTEYIEYFSHDFECFVDGQYEYYDNVDFCPGNDTTSTTISTSSSETSPTSTTSTTTTSSTSSPTTSKPWNRTDLIKLDCRDITNYASFKYRNLQRFYSHTVMIRQQSILFSFYQLEDEPTFELKIDGNVSTDSLLWINSENFSDINCVCNMRENILLENLNYTTTYTLCLLPDNKTGISPYDCTSLTVPPDWGSQAWVPNRLMMLVIGLMCASLIATTLVTGFIVFYCIRQHPNLIKGNKRVIIVESKAADAIVMPKAYEKLKYSAPSLKSCSDGYLTPKIYETRAVLSHLPVISEAETAQFGSLSNNKLSNSQASLNSELDDGMDTISSHFYEPPPPLPPNHPTNKLINLVANHL